MKNKYETVYERLYSLSVDRFFKSGEKVRESFIFQGSDNWDMYCKQIGKNREFELLENVELIGFDTTKEVREFEIPRDKIIDFSREHATEIGVEKYFLLIQK
jgi:hypothetical protein